MDTELEEDVDIIDDPVTPAEEKTPPPDPNEDLRNAVQELTRIQTEAAKPKEPEEKELTAEQKAEMWAVYNPEASKKDFMKKFWKLNPDASDEEVAEAREYFSDMQRGIVKQAIKGSMNIYQAELAKLREELKTKLDPIEKDYADTRAAKMRERFSAEYEDFADPKYNKLLELADRAQAGKQFKSEAEYFKAVAETAAEALKTGQPDFILGAVKNKPTKTTGLTARSPRLIAGSGSGGGSGGGGKTQAPDDADVWDIPS